jgi:hypothetical protein
MKYKIAQIYLDVTHLNQLNYITKIEYNKLWSIDDSFYHRIQERYYPLTQVPKEYNLYTDIFVI